MRHYGNRARTRADKERDVILFCSMARDDKIRAATPESLARSTGADVRFCAEKLLAAQGKLERERAFG